MGPGEILCFLQYSVSADKTSSPDNIILIYVNAAK
jgi:hypothetical protein